MPATPESRARAFARVIVPWLVIVACIVVARTPGIETFVSDVSDNSVLARFSGALLPLGGPLIIAFRQPPATIRTETSRQPPTAENGTCVDLRCGPDDDAPALGLPLRPTSMQA